MTQADSVHSTPPINTSRLQNIVEQEDARQASLQIVRRLRREARDEIDRLLSFLDASDTYVTTELEDDGDQADASYPENGARLCSPNEDDEEDDAGEDAGDDEPSIGSGAVGQHSTQTEWAVRGDGCVDAEDEHNGAEPDHEGDSNENDEPSLGWTVDGCISNTGVAGCDAELQGHAPVRPQRRTRLGKGVHASPNYWQGNRVLGLTGDQKARFDDKRRRASKSGVVS